MRDSVSQIRVQRLHPKVRDEVVATIDEVEARLPKNMAVRIVQGKRSKEEQDEIYAQGRTKPGKIVTKAQWYATYHFYGNAIDYALLIDKDGNGSYETVSWDRNGDLDNDRVADWLEVANAFKAKGWSWGGDWLKFKDYPHLEKTCGQSWRTLYKRLLNKETFVDPITKIQYVIL